MDVSTTMQTPRKWKPDRPVSKGAEAYHEAVVNAPYYIENLREFVNIVSDKIKEDDIVVDFGEGIGVLVLYFLKYLKIKFRLWLVDNSAAWLGKAYDIFKDNPNVSCFLLEKINGRYETLAEIVGNDIADHVISANTVHLIPDLGAAFKGIYSSIKPLGTFTFQSGNISRDGREKGTLMVDDTVKRVHDLALDIIRTNDKFQKYRKDLDKRIQAEDEQRKFVFPDPRPLEIYLKNLKDTGFKYIEMNYKLIRIKYKDWLNFLRVKRLQAGILPEVGGKEASAEEAHDRDLLITLGSDRLFKELEEKNPMADDKSFTTEWVYVSAKKVA